jgi:hypothetical protein
MTGDPRRPDPKPAGRPARLEPIDDAAIQELVRDAAHAWTMPAVRLDAPSWRDRVRSPRARRLDAARGWLGRVGQAATGAIALTVVAALAAVLITRPPGDPGSSGDTSGPPGSPRPTGVAVTPLPKLHLEGDLPDPSLVLVKTDGGDFALVDLETGRSGGDLTGAEYGSAVQVRVDGSLMCLCVKLSGNVNGSATHAEVTLDRFDRTGKLTSTVSVAALDGEPDPRDGPIPERPPHLSFWTSFSEGGHYGFIGWSIRAHPVWRSGITVIDLVDGREVGRFELPEGTSGEGETRRVVLAPRVVGSAGGSSVTIAREWYEWSPPESLGENFRQGTEVFRADFAGGSFANLAPVDASGCGERVLRAGATADDRYWIACTRFATSAVVVRRFDGAGGKLGDTSVHGGLGVDGDVTAVSPDRSKLFVWNAISSVLTRVDLASGETAEGRGPTAAVDPGPLAAFGDWLAPPVAAKTFLDGGVVVSPDGSRVFATGVDPGAADHDTGGSSGVFAFDAVSLESLGRWTPTADFVSLAISPDGRYLYAAGLPGVGADGTPRPAQQASITVFDTADGTPRLIAGQLGGDLLTFVSPTLE